MAKRRDREDLSAEEPESLRGPQFDAYYSGGMDVLAGKIRALGPDVEMLPTFGFSQWKKIAKDIQKQPSETRIVIYGHSMGANQITAATAALGNRRVDLIAAFDPTILVSSQGCRRECRTSDLVSRQKSFLAGRPRKIESRRRLQG